MKNFKSDSTSTTININSISIFLLLFFLFTNSILYAQKRSKKDISESYKDKNLQEIKEELTELKSKIEAAQSVSNLRISGGPILDIESKYITNFSMTKGDDDVIKRFNTFKDNISFDQQVIDETSEVDVHLYYKLNYYPESYADIDLKKTEFTINTLYFFDGKKKEINSKEDEFTIEELKKIDSVSITYSYQYLKDYDKITLNKKVKKSDDDKITLSYIYNDEVEFKIDSSLNSKLLYIEAIDSTGKALRVKSKFKSTTNSDAQQEKFLEELKAFAEQSIKQIESKKIKNKEELINYMYKNQPVKLEPKEISMVTHFNTYAGNIESINIYINPIIIDKSKTFYISTNTQYKNGLEIAIKNDKYGLIDKNGYWVIAPKYEYISGSFIDNYYTISHNDTKTLHLFNVKNKTLKPVPYFIMTENIYGNRYLEISSSPYSNIEKGLVDLKTSEIILPPKKRSLDANNTFFMSIIYHEGNKPSFYEVFRFSDNKKVLEGEFENVILDNDNIIVEYAVELNEKPNGGYMSSMRSGVRKYYHNYYDIYDVNGKKINKKSYNDLPDNENFSKENLLLVEQSADRNNNEYEYAFINRKTKQLDIDLSSYSIVKSFSNGLAVVCDKTSKKYGFINPKGELIIPTMYSRANHFMGGTAAVGLRVSDNSYKTVLINEKNEIIFTFPDAIISYSSKHDAQEATYYCRNKKTYNHKGKIIKENY